MSSERTSFRPKCRSLMGVRVIGTGKYIPDMVVSNDHLHARLGFDSDWIVKRTGILERRHAAPNQATSDLCVEAVNDLFAKTGRTAKDCDLLVLGTFTPDMSFPSTACLVQDRIGLVGPAIEVEAACAGFMYALITAAAYVKAGLSERALVIGGDTNSRVLNPADRIKASSRTVWVPKGGVGHSCNVKHVAAECRSLRNEWPKANTTCTWT